MGKENTDLLTTGRVINGDKTVGERKRGRARTGGTITLASSDAPTGQVIAFTAGVLDSSRVALSRGPIIRTQTKYGQGGTFVISRTQQRVS